MCISQSYAANNIKYYGPALCKKPGYTCITIKSGDSWQKLFPNPIHLDIVQRINRTNMRLWRGKKIAVPKNLEKISLFDVSPFPRTIDNHTGKMLLIDQEKLAWGAYDNGDLVLWGPISSGKNYCSDVKRACITKTGIYYVFHKKDKKCESNIFPVGRGGAKMPYCMFYYRGYALHGSYEVPGYRDSHGCVRLFIRDAKWLNKDFVRLSTKENDFKGTKVIVQKLTNFKVKK